MADRIASVSRFRAEGVLLDWPAVVRRMVAQAGQWDQLEELKWLQRAAENRGREIALRWATSSVLGAPPGPFTVWVRQAGASQPARPVDVTSHPLGRLLTWSGEASTLEVTATVADGATPVLLVGFRGAAGVPTAVASARATGTTGGTVNLLLRSSGMTCALLVGSSGESATVDYLAEVVRADDWREWEVVGLPVGWGSDGADLRLAGYDGRKQGLVSALTTPDDAALQRLDRGGPPVGWPLVTETGQVAPPWRPPVFERLLHRARELLPEAADLYTVPPPQQAGLTTARLIPPPEQDGRTLAADSSATVGPLGALMLPATTDPYYALTLGFGTGYRTDDRELLGVDFLVTADYPETPEGGPATYAAYVPRPVRHSATAPVTGLSAGRDGLIRPVTVDAPWRETLRVSWDAVTATAALGRPTGFGLLRFDPAAGPMTQCLLDHWTTDEDWLPRVPSRAPGPVGGPPSATNTAVDAQREIPLGSGGQTVGYSVAVADVFGIWSTWEDAAATTAEPGPPQPRILSARLDVAYTGSASACPASLALEVALDWSDRTVAQLDLSVVLFPAATTTASPPAGPGTVVASVPFAGDTPIEIAGVRVRSLDSSGLVEVPPGPAQSEEGRRYEVTVPLSALDYTATRYWGAAVWARTSLSVLGTGSWAPPSPALSYAMSPVPPVLPPPPPLPGVPVGSTPDARGQSHVRVVWGTPAGPVDHFAVYEVAETALRSVLPSGALPALPATASPGARLAQLKTAYDTLLTPAQRRSVFRRILQPGAAERSVDVALPKGSTDIHLFVVIGVAPGSVESPWPQTSDSLQAFRAPVVLAPATPSLRPSFVDVSGVPQLRLDLEAESPVPVTTFRLFRTTLVDAARAAETMGPAFAEVSATVTADPPSPTGTRRYTGSWQGVPATGWRPSRYRAVAVPVPSVPVDGSVGVPSPGSPVVPITIPPALPPDLGPLVAEDRDGTGLVVRSTTRAPLWRSDAGPHLLRASATVAGAAVFPEISTALDALTEAPGSGVSGASPPAGGDPGPLLVRDARAAGVTPLSLWFRRPAVSDEVVVTLRLVDPLGRSTTQTLTIPPETVAVPPTLDVVETFVVPGRGIVLRFTSDAPVTATADGAAVLHLAATRRMHPWLRPRPVEYERSVPDIPVGATFPLAPGRSIVVVRRTSAAPYEYAALVRVTPPAVVVLTMTGATGGTASVRVAVPGP